MFNIYNKTGFLDVHLYVFRISNVFIGFQNMSEEKNYNVVQYFAGASASWSSDIGARLFVRRSDWLSAVMRETSLDSNDVASPVRSSKAV